jgi:predicted DNA-binding transcriptional regulator AlpA
MVKKTKTVTNNELGRNEIVRLRDGRRYFGYGPTTLAEKIKAGEIPEPIRLGDRARGRQIIEWQEAQFKKSK